MLKVGDVAGGTEQDRAVEWTTCGKPEARGPKWGPPRLSLWPRRLKKSSDFLFSFSLLKELKCSACIDRGLHIPQCNTSDATLLPAISLLLAASTSWEFPDNAVSKTDKDSRQCLVRQTIIYNEKVFSLFFHSQQSNKQTRLCVDANMFAIFASHMSHQFRATQHQRATDLGKCTQSDGSIRFRVDLGGEPHVADVVVAPPWKPPVRPPLMGTTFGT